MTHLCRNNLLYLNFNFHCRRTLGDKFIGRVSVPINPLLAMTSGNRTASQVAQYPVMTSSGELRGIVNFCFGFGNSIRPLGLQQPAPQWRPPRPPHVVLEAKQLAPQWQPTRPPHVVLEAKQPAPQWQPTRPLHVALEAQLEVHWGQNYYTSEPQTLENQVNYGSNAQANDDRANQYDYGDQAYQFDYGDQANEFDDDDKANQYDYGDQANEFDDVSDY
ncbi:Protein SRC2 [Camellia lanceoleosa]|uniref:Protein SRC2 n=1 Tax=Camellia lanceoleosa TaxID=1840588 RepID=A0ACC0F602_9ERIC|nr:Protein SRC2 [Camellia lanceoleosa]